MILKIEFRTKNTKYSFEQNSVNVERKHGRRSNTTNKIIYKSISNNLWLLLKILSILVILYVYIYI